MIYVTQHVDVDVDVRSFYFGETVQLSQLSQNAECVNSGKLFVRQFWTVLDSFWTVGRKPSKLGTAYKGKESYLSLDSWTVN